MSPAKSTGPLLQRHSLKMPNFSINLYALFCGFLLYEVHSVTLWSIVVWFKKTGERDWWSRLMTPALRAEFRRSIWFWLAQPLLVFSCRSLEGVHLFNFGAKKKKPRFYFYSHKRHFLAKPTERQWECISLIKSKSGFLIRKGIFRFFTNIQKRIIDAQQRWIL